MVLTNVENAQELLENADTYQALESAIEEIADKASDPAGFIKNLIADYGLIDKAILVILAILLYLVGVRVIKYIRKILKRSLQKADLDAGVIQFVDSLAKAFLYLVLFTMIISCFGVGTTSIAAVVGSAGLAVGLALQGSLSNFAGGVLLLLLHPFKVGDYIIEDTNKNEGTVQRIELFYTTLVTGDNKVITIPNGTLANSSLTNVSAQDKRRLDLKVGIGYQSDLKKAKAILEDIVTSDSDTLQEEGVAVFVDELADSAVMLGIRVWFAKENFWPAKWRITERIKLEFDAAGIEIPYNQMDVNLKYPLESSKEEIR